MGLEWILVELVMLGQGQYQVFELEKEVALVVVEELLSCNWRIVELVVVAVGVERA